MKKLILIVGPNGVGKSTTSYKLLYMLSNSAYVDSDWCRATNPFMFTEATKEVVTNNIYCMIKNYLQCEDINTVIYPYTFHGGRKAIFEEVIQRLQDDGIEFELCPIILKCSKEENIRRAIEDGRDMERVDRGMKDTFSFYDEYTYPKIETTSLSPDEVAQKVIDIVFNHKNSSEGNLL